MTEVCIVPLPEKYRKITPLYWPRTRPIFTDIDECGIIESDRNLARELFQLLDEESKSWYSRTCKWLEEKPFEKLEKSKKSKAGRKKK